MLRFDGQREKITGLAIVTLCAVLMVAGCSGSSGGDDPRPDPRPVEGPLNILLVNDDGWDADGITAVYDGLRAAGHDVTLVAPSQNQSGASMSTGSDPLQVTQPEPGTPKYSVVGTPVDAVNVGLFGVLADNPPDLVVSGANLGANVAGNTNYSGTVGAAAAAAEADVPALAVSAAADAEGHADFGDASRTVVDMVEALAKDGFDGLGRDGFLNVNIPAETDGRSEPRGIRVAALADVAPRSVRYEKTGSTTWTPSFTYDPEVGQSSADAAKLADGWTTVTWLTVARTSPAGRRAQVERLVGQLTH